MYGGSGCATEHFAQGSEWASLHEGKFAYPRAPSTGKQKNRPLQHDHLMRYGICLIDNLYCHLSEFPTVLDPYSLTPLIKGTNQIEVLRRQLKTL